MKKIKRLKEYIRYCFFVQAVEHYYLRLEYIIKYWWQIFICQMINPVDKILNEIVKKLLKDKKNYIVDITYPCDEFRICIKFSDGTILTGWDENKYYSWFDEGTITNDLNQSISYKWKDKRLSRRTMWKLHNKIVEYYLDNDDE